MESDLDKLRWLEYQLEHSTEESLLREFEQLEREVELKGIHFPEPPEGFFQEIIRRGKEMEKERLVEKWEDQYGEFEDKCPVCGGVLHIVNKRDENRRQPDQMKFWCDDCEFSWESL